jgi:hypothetical protein
MGGTSVDGRMMIKLALVIAIIYIDLAEDISLQSFLK